MPYALPRSLLAMTSSVERRGRISRGSGGDGGSGGDDGERRHMARPDIVEVPAVHSGNRGNTQAFGDGYQRGVGAAQSSIGVLADELGHPPQVGVSKVHRAELACGLAADRIEELCLGDRTAEPVDEVARLGKNGDRKGQLVSLLLQPATAEFMCCVGAIRQRHDDVGVYQNHDGRSAAKAVGKQLVHPLGEVVASTVEAPDEPRQRSATGVSADRMGLRNRLDCE